MKKRILDNSINKHICFTLDPDQQPIWTVDRVPLVARHIILISLIVFALFATAACEKKSPAAESLYRQQLTVFGTRVEIMIWGSDPAVAQQAVVRIAADFRQMHRDWHAWKPGALVRLNRQLAAGKKVHVGPQLLSLIKHSKEMYRRSDGLFNPAIGKLIGLWGFHRDRFPTQRPLPAKSAIDRLQSKRPSMDDIVIRGNWVMSRNAAVQLDFGGIAKGYAIDLAVRRLKQFGIRNAVINAGGDLRVIGKRGERFWRVGVRHPQGPGILATIEVREGEGVFTSGNYERFNEHAGVRYPHIINPRTGWPVRGVSSVTVIHRNGVVADAAATALVIAGPGNWHRIARRMGIRLVMLVDENGKVVLSPGMATRVRFEVPGPAHVRLSRPL